jgi:glutathione S-transferase
MQYLASQAGPNELFPDVGKIRADIARWQFWEAAHFNRAVGTMTFEAFIKPRFGIGETDAGNWSKALADFHRFAAILQDNLSNRQFVVGDTPTLADFSLGSHLMYAEAARVPLAGYPAICKWYERLEALPAWQASAPVM